MKRAPTLLAMMLLFGLFDRLVHDYLFSVIKSRPLQFLEKLGPCIVKTIISAIPPL